MKRLVFILVITMCSLIANGYNYIDVTKTGSGENLIIITGVGGNILWGETIKDLSQKYTCHIVSIKGISGDKSNLAPDKNLIGNEILEYMRVNKIKNPNIMGHSVGGNVALETVLISPGAFSKIILVDSYPCNMAMGIVSVTEQMRKSQSENFSGYLNSLNDENFLKFWEMMSKGFFRDSLKQKIFLKIVADSERSSLTKIQSAVISEDLRPELIKISSPVMVLCAGESFKQLSLPEEELTQRINNQFSQVKKYEMYINMKSKHFIMSDEKDWFSDKILTFLSK